MTETTMKEARLFGKLLPTHPDILPVLEEIRENYNIKDIKPEDDSLKELLEFGLDIDWDAVHAEILERLKESDLLPEKAKDAYNSYHKVKTIGLVDPELDKLSEEFKNGLIFLIDLLLKQYEPIFASFDAVFQKIAGNCIVAVGTTTTRALEGAYEAVLSGEGWVGEVNIFITPGYDFEVIDALITNFHLPKSTLLALVSAFVGREEALLCYKEAVKKKYRFFSFGDAMFLR